MSNTFILLLAVVCALLSSSVVAQINGGQFPQACQSQCQSLLNLVTTCGSEYSNNGDPPASAACVCNGVVNQDYSSCTTCLNTNDPTIAQSVSGLASYCTELKNTCAFECGFTTCSSSDVACQCKPGYLQDIYDCASCNTAHHNTNATTMNDYTALRDSCVHQGYTQIPTATDPPLTPSGTISYTFGGSQPSGSTRSSTTRSATNVQSRNMMTIISNGLSGTLSETNTPTILTGSSTRLEFASLDMLLFVTVAALTLMRA